MNWTPDPLWSVCICLMKIQLEKETNTINTLIDYNSTLLNKLEFGPITKESTNCQTSYSECFSVWQNDVMRRRVLDQVAKVMFLDLQQLNILLSAKIVQGLLFMGTNHLEIVLQLWLQQLCRNLKWRLYTCSLRYFVFYISHLKKTSPGYIQCSKASYPKQTMN